MTFYKVFCGDCFAKYEQTGYKPRICSQCGSDFIAVKAINVADDMPLEDEETPVYVGQGTATLMM